MHFERGYEPANSFLFVKEPLPRVAGHRCVSRKARMERRRSLLETTTRLHLLFGEELASAECRIQLEHACEVPPVDLQQSKLQGSQSKRDTVVHPRLFFGISYSCSVCSYQYPRERANDRKFMESRFWCFWSLYRKSCSFYLHLSILSSISSSIWQMDCYYRNTPFLVNLP